MVVDFGEAHGALAVVVVEVEAAALAEEEEVDVVVVIVAVIGSLAEEEETVPVTTATKKGTLQGSVPKETAGTTVKIMGTTQDPTVLIYL